MRIPSQGVARREGPYPLRCHDHRCAVSWVHERALSGGRGVVWSTQTEVSHPAFYTSVPLAESLFMSGTRARPPASLAPSASLRLR